jgi:hypothetical protein
MNGFLCLNVPEERTQKTISGYIVAFAPLTWRYTDITAKCSSKFAWIIITNHIRNFLTAVYLLFLPNQPNGSFVF